eukprot:8232472-Ditylum_brightwellii.AAC.1
MGGDKWNINDNWNDPGAHPCDWYGVYCDVGNQIINRITMLDNNLQGAVPIELWQMPNLRILDLSTNAIDFQFEGISECSSLKGLYLSDTGLSSLEGIGELADV